MNNIAGIAFHELESEKYWAFPKNYKKDSKAETKNMSKLLKRHTLSDRMAHLQ